MVALVATIHVFLLFYLRQTAEKKRKTWILE